MNCVIDGCTRPVGQVRRQGWCNHHYSRWQRLSDPLAPNKTLKGLSLAEKLERGSSISPNGCRVWQGKKHDAMGYARIEVDGRMQYVHRLSWERAHGPVPDGMVLMHSCDNPSCINLNHLSIGTQQENVRDMVRKGRCDRRGDKANPAKLTWSQVRELRQLDAAGISRRELSRHFGISVSQVDNIRHNRHWIENRKESA